MVRADARFGLDPHWEREFTRHMKPLNFPTSIVALLTAYTVSETTGLPAEGNPAARLPTSTRRVTWFGERPDWSHDGRKLLVLEKTFGDVYELELDTQKLRPITHHYPHFGYTRALYLGNGDVLLSGPESFDIKNPQASRGRCFLYVLDKNFRTPPVSLGTQCSEGPAVSRKRLHIAWTHVSGQYPAEMTSGSSRIFEADIEYRGGVPQLANQRTVLDSTRLPFKCTLETQNFRPPHETELTFSTYGYQGTEVFGVELSTGKVTNYSNAPQQYDEPEGVFPDGISTLVECDRQNGKGWQFIDLWKLRLDGTGALERLTFFSDYRGYKASNGVVSDEGRWLAFQMAKTDEPAGVGHGIFVMELPSPK